MNEYYKESIKVSIFSIITNALLSIFKFIAGIIGHSSAMVSDAIHSLSDVISTIIVIIGLNISNKKSDDSHQYGHEKFESIAALFLSFLLILTALWIGYSGIYEIIKGVKGNIIIPTTIALIASIISILVKEVMYQITKVVAIKSKSNALMADAWHHRSDALSSVGSLIGIGMSMIGFPILDKIVSLIICILILKVSIDILKDAIYKLVDASCNENTIEDMKKCILKVDGVIDVDLIKTRMFGSKIYMDVEISANKNLTLESSHLIASNVHDEIEKNFLDVKHCMVHVNPK